MAPRVRLVTNSYVCTACQRAVLRRERRRFASNAASTPDVYDVVTVGGGPAGLALLAALKSSPVTSHLKTALIETQDLSRQRHWQLSPEQFSNRASSLTPSSVDFLQQSGVWEHVDQSRVQPYDEMQVWDAANDASIQFDWRREAQRYNAPLQTVATMVENANLTKGLLGRIEELDGGSSLFSNTSVSLIENGKDDPEGLNLSTWPLVSLLSKDSSSSSPTKQIAARLLVGADGFNSPVRAYAGISSHGWDYGRHGVVATLNLEPNEEASDSYDSIVSDGPSNRATAYQRFLPQLGGPIAILPLPNNCASLVWSTTPSTAAYLKTLSESSLIAMINAAVRLSQIDLKYLLNLPADSSDQHAAELEWRLKHTSTPSIAGPIPVITSVQPGTLASFPLRFRHATALSGPRIALIGDAAHTVHPLAGQGLNLGLGDAHELANAISNAVEHGMDLGDAMALEQYSRNRFGKGILMAGGIDALNSLYQLGSGDGIVSSIISQARGLGMKAIGSNLFPGLKGVIMKQAEG